MRIIDFAAIAILLIAPQAAAQSAGEGAEAVTPNSRILPEIAHIGFVVADAPGAARQAMEELGLPPSSLIVSTVYPVTDAKYEGGVVDYTLDLQIVETGNTQLEYIQVLEGRSPYSDAHAAAGKDLVHHIAYIVPSIDAHLESARGRGLQPSIIVDALIGEQGRFVYVEGVLPGTLVELIELYPQAAEN